MTAPALTAELLYAELAEPDLEAILERVRETLPESALVDPGDDPEASPMIVHERFGTVIADGTRVPLFTALTLREPRQVSEAEHDFGQTWGWPEAKEVVARARTAVMVAEVMGTLHPPADRLAAFRTTLEAAVAVTAPLAIWSQNATKFVPPEHANGLESFVNVRLFRVEDSDGEMVMDSLGLHAFGLPDVQCHFRDLDPNDVSRLLYDTAAYVLDHGDVIEDGHTVPGLDGEERWRCRHEAALVGPEREVLDVEPSAPFAAGRG